MNILNYTSFKLCFMSQKILKYVGNISKTFNLLWDFIVHGIHIILMEAYI